MISLIIPTRNRADLLEKTLESVAIQTFPVSQFEVIVVDNGSTDNTPEVVKDFTGRLKNLRYEYEPVPGLHAGRHRGLKEALGDILVYADDDIRATPSWLSAIAENFVDPEIAMVGGNNYPDFQGEVPGWLDRLWARHSMGGHVIDTLSILSLPGERRDLSPYLVWGCNLSIRKQVLLDAGGFHPDGMPRELIRFRGDGETHVSRYVSEKKLRCVFDPHASVYHAVTPERMTFDYFWQRSFNHGISDSYTQLRNKSLKASLSAYPRAIARRLLGPVRHILKYAKGNDPGLNDPELLELQKLMQEGYREGFKYHQRMYREDPEVRAWVHKPNYF